MGKHLFCPHLSAHTRFSLMRATFDISMLLDVETLLDWFSAMPRFRRRTGRYRSSRYFKSVVFSEIFCGSVQYYQSCRNRLVVEAQVVIERIKMRFRRVRPSRTYSRLHLRGFMAEGKEKRLRPKCIMPTTAMEQHECSRIRSSL